MNSEVMALIEEMLREIEGMSQGEIGDVDAVWDRNYDTLIELAVDENCGDSITCDEDAVHDEMADIRVMYYDRAEETSYECRGCGRRLYGREAEGERLCRRCR